MIKYSMTYVIKKPFSSAIIANKNSIRKHYLHLFFAIFILFHGAQSCFGLAVKAFFSPGGQVAKELEKRILAAKTSINAAVYTFTDLTIAQALVRAKKRGLSVQIVVDRTSVESPWGKVRILLEGGVDVFCKITDKVLSFAKGVMESLEPGEICQCFEGDFLDQKGFNSFIPLMHHKYAVFDANSVWTGSFNWTTAANMRNNENVVIIDDCKDLAADFGKNFTELLTVCKKVDMQMLEAMVKARKDCKLVAEKKRSDKYLQLAQNGGQKKELRSKTKRRAKARKIGKGTSYSGPEVAYA